MTTTFEVRAWSDNLEEGTDRSVQAMFTVANLTNDPVTGAGSITADLPVFAGSTDFGDSFATPFSPGESRTVRAAIVLAPSVDVGVYPFRLAVSNAGTPGEPADESDPVMLYVKTAATAPPPVPPSAADTQPAAPPPAPVPDPQPATGPAPEPSSGGGFPVWGIVLIIVGVLVLGGGITALVVAL